MRLDNFRFLAKILDMSMSKQDIAEARRLARTGYSRQEITENLVESGLREQDAAKLADNAVSMVERRLSKQGIR